MRIARLLGLVLLLFCPHAITWTVIDPANLVQNTASVAKAVQQLTQTAERIDFEVKAAQRLLKKMQELDLTKIRDIVGLINMFRTRARSIGYTYEQVEHQFERLYGKYGIFSKNFAAWQKQSDDSIKDAMISQGLIEKSEKHMADLDEIIKIKNASQCDNDTLQAIGEINAIQAKQLAELSQMIATDARAKQSVMMENRSKQKAQEEYEAHLMKDFNTHGKSRPLAHFPSLGATAPRL